MLRASAGGIESRRRNGPVAVLYAGRKHNLGQQFAIEHFMLRDDHLWRRRRLDRPADFIQAFARGGQAAEQVRERYRISHRKMKAVALRRHLFRHSADVGTNDWATIAKRLLNHQRRILPPDARNKHQIYILHQLVNSIVHVRTVKPNIISCDREPGGKVGLKLRWLATIVAEDVKRDGRFASLF